MSRWRRPGAYVCRLAAVCLLTVVGGWTLTGCRSLPLSDTATPAMETLAGWAEVDLGPAVPTTLTATSDGLLVGGHTGTGATQRPVLVRLRAEDRPAATPVPLRASTPYGAVADLASVAADGRQIHAVGGARGGAHSNVRWSTWTGTGDGLSETKQPFETFGGTEAGGVLGVETTESGPVMAGSWSGVFGLDAAVWVARGDRWVRHSSAGTALANDPTRQVSLRGAAAVADQVVLSGSVVRLGDGVRQSAAVWTWPTRAAPWTLVELPDPGLRSEAHSAACTLNGCLVAGLADSRSAVWRTGATPVRELTPQLPMDETGPLARAIASADREVVVITSGPDVVLLVRTTTGWRAFRGPAGTAVDAALVGETLYLVLRDDRQPSLWQRSLSDLPH